MKKIYGKTLNLILLSFFLFNISFIVKAAGNASVSLSGNDTVYVGSDITIKMIVSNVNGANGGVVSLGGNLSFDSSCLEYISSSGATSPYTFQINPAADYKIAGLDTSLSNGITANTTVFTFTFRAKRICSSIVTLKNAKLSDVDDIVSVNVSGKTINIIEVPSANNNLSKLNVSNQNINFNKDNTFYNLNVGNNIDNITITAEAEDSNASVSGTGIKSLNYGDNEFNIIVTAPNGQKKTYNININRKDNRSNNNNLSSLNVNGGVLEPKFSSNKIEYSLDVPYSVNNLEVSAKAEDKNAKIAIVGQNDLVAEETRDVKIHVTAENGSIKTYTIHVTRGKDPNKILSNNNYLSSLTVSTGILSPEFNKEKENYIVYLPFEVESIEINATVEDTKYAVLKQEGNKSLSIGNNEYLLKVTAENNSVRTYKVTVVRGMNLEPSNIDSNIYLKSLKLQNAELTKKFNKKEFLYTYKNTSGKKLNIEAKAEDKNSNISIENVKDIYIITVESVNGDKGVYILKPKEKFNITMLLISISFCSAIIFTVIGYVIGKKFNNLKSKDKIKLKKEKTDKK